MILVGVKLVFVTLAALAIAADEHPPVIPPPPPEASSLNKAVLKNIEDDAPVRNRFENREEALAYDYIVNFARRVPDASFRAAAQKDLTFGHLLGVVNKQVPALQKNIIQPDHLVKLNVRPFVARAFAARRDRSCKHQRGYK